jgi:hypothetical protein
MLTQKHYESNSTRSEIETKANDIQLTPKWICGAIGNPIIKVSKLS